MSKSGDIAAVIDRAVRRQRIGAQDALALAECGDLTALLEGAAAIRDDAFPRIITYSPKVFIPLTKLCRDVCHYCTFAQPPRRGERAYLTAAEVLAIARAGAQAGCHEALFTLGDKPELRYQAARDELEALGCATTLGYLKAMARLVLEETGLLPHLNPGVMDRADLLALRKVSVSQGLMLESSSQRLCEKGGPHFGSPDKLPSARLATIAAAGAARVPFTSGILIGIGETRRERIEALLALRELHEVDGHLQEIIIQNFRRKPDTKMAQAAEPHLDEQLWTVAVARLIFGPAMHVQAPPNLNPDGLQQLIRAGIDDWGGVSPVTVDHVNPEAPWPERERLAAASAAEGKTLVPRLAVYPDYLQHIDRWLDAELRTAVLRRIDAEGYARSDDWSPGAKHPIPFTVRPGAAPGRKSELGGIIDRAAAGRRLDEDAIVRLFAARGEEFEAVCGAADALRAEANGDVVSYVVNRNINYTNICYFGCGFCAFSKGRVAENLRERGYDLPVEEIMQRSREAWQRGATEVCLQGGIHPDYTGATYLAIARAVKEAQPRLHIHAFSPLEIRHGAETLGLSLPDYLDALKDAGLSTLPGTAAEILDDDIRQIICPDKLDTEQWLEVMHTAHGRGLKSTATIMFGHVEPPLYWARHLLRIRDLQVETGGFTEFVPLPFVHMEAPLYRRGRARKGPSFREAVLMHAVARLVLHTQIDNIQASWVKMGRDGATACLGAGVNDLGGTLMNESISRAAGASHGQGLDPDEMQRLIRSLGRTPRQRTTLYGDVGAEAAAPAGTEHAVLYA